MIIHANAKVFNDSKTEDIFKRIWTDSLYGEEEYALSFDCRVVKVRVPRVGSKRQFSSIVAPPSRESSAQVLFSNFPFGYTEAAIRKVLGGKEDFKGCQIQVVKYKRDFAAVVTMSNPEEVAKYVDYTKLVYVGGYRLNAGRVKTHLQPIHASSGLPTLESFSKSMEKLVLSLGTHSSKRVDARAIVRQISHVPKSAPASAKSDTPPSRKRNGPHKKPHKERNGKEKMRKQSGGMRGNSGAVPRPTKILKKKISQPSIVDFTVERSNRFDGLMDED